MWGYEQEKYGVNEKSEKKFLVDFINFTSNYSQIGFRNMVFPWKNE